VLNITAECRIILLRIIVRIAVNNVSKVKHHAAYDHVDDVLLDVEYDLTLSTKR
jgi:hypothetical protein